MKNLMIYINPRKGFDDEHARYAEIQIENSLNYWKKEDILLVTNFPYEYYGLKALVVNDDLYCQIHNKASKINTVIYLLENNILNDLIWLHDFEAFQINPLDIELKNDVGFTDYGWSPKWNTGSVFFKPSSLDVFEWIKNAVYSHKTDEERALMVLTNGNFNNINSRYERLNITYNLGKRKIDYNLSIAHKPIRVVHFHPYKEGLFERFKHLLPDNLIKLINEKSSVEKNY